jgi:hypothetical protein
MLCRTCAILGIHLKYVFNLQRNVVEVAEPEKALLKQHEMAGPVFHFVTYRTFGTCYFSDASHLANVANATGWFQTSTVYSEKDIPAWALTKYEVILRCRRGRVTGSGGFH